MVTDPRLRNIPLILETHDYESPTTVWKTEISVLNQLSCLAKSVPFLSPLFKTLSNMNYFCHNRDGESPIDWENKNEKERLGEITSQVEKVVTAAKQAEEDKKKSKEDKKRKRTKKGEESGDE